MLEADPPHTTNPPTAPMPRALSRRQVFLAGVAASGALALPAAANAASNPDAALIADCAEYGRLGALSNDVWNSAVTDAECDRADDLTEQWHGRQEELLDLIVETRASTLAGVTARARALVRYDPDMADPEGFGANGWNDYVARAVIRDLLAVTGGAA